MNNRKLNIDGHTKELFSKLEIDKPQKDFTKNVMSRILKDPAVKINFISKDDKNSNIWLIVSIMTMVFGYCIFILVKNNFNLHDVGNFQKPSYLNLLVDFFSKLWSELSLSPYILVSLVGVVVLVLLDKAIVKYLYSI